MDIGITVSIQPPFEGTNSIVRISVYPTEGPNRFNDMAIYQDTIPLSPLSDFLSVQTFVIKALSMVSVAMQEEVDDTGYTPPAELMLENFERK